MRQLPTLQTPQTNYLGFAQAIEQKKRQTKQDAMQTEQNNFLKQKYADESKNRAEDRNFLIEGRESKQKQAHLQQQAKAISEALKAQTPAQGQAIYESLGGDPTGKIDFLGDDVDIDYGGHSLKAPAGVLSEMMGKISENPEWANDPQTWAWFASQGGSMEKKEAKMPGIQTFQQGNENVTQRWNPKTKKMETIASGSRTPEHKPQYGWATVGDTKVWTLLQEGTTTTTKKDGSYSPSPLRKLMKERQALLDDGFPIDHPDIKAYNNKITGTDVDAENMSPDEVSFWGENYNLTGKFPTLGRGKAAVKARMSIAKSAARLAMGADADGVPDIPDKTPAEAALATVSKQADTKSIQGSLNFLDKQLSSMGSFVNNLNAQVDKFTELSKEIKTFDTRLLNIPLRTLRGRLFGSALQAKADLYLTEIEAEIGKLATGATGSVAELSQGAQEKWAKIHDKNLSIKDMLSLLEETKHAANFRIGSVRNQLNETRTRMKTRDYGNDTTPTPIAEIENMQPGEMFTGPDGKKYRKN